MGSVPVSRGYTEHYDGYYSGPSEWRRVCALGKADDVVRLCAGVAHDEILEIGAGDGSLLARLGEIGFGASHYAVEISTSALEAIADRKPARLVEARHYDGDRIPYGDRRFDLAVLSHVVEHLEHPRHLLYEAARVARRVFVEVPLEDTLRAPRDFVPDSLGHINAYTPRSLRHLVQSCGMDVEAECVVNPGRETYTHRMGARGRLPWAIKQLALRVAPPLATRLWTYHGALLARPKPGA